jgi:hypothetical protein
MHIFFSRCAANTPKWLAALYAFASSLALAQGQPAPQLAPLQPKVPMQPKLPTDSTSVKINGSALSAPVQPRIPPVPVARKTDIALQSITYAEANVMANDEVKISFRATAKNIGGTDVANARVRCGVTPSKLDLGPNYVGAPWASQSMVAYGGVSNPGDTHVVPFALMMPFSSNAELKRKYLKIICRLDFDATTNDSVATNNRLESSVQFPDDVALNFPLLGK